MEEEPKPSGSLCVGEAGWACAVWSTDAVGLVRELFVGEGIELDWIEAHMEWSAFPRT